MTLIYFIDIHDLFIVLTYDYDIFLHESAIGWLRIAKMVDQGHIFSGSCTLCEGADDSPSSSIWDNIWYLCDAALFWSKIFCGNHLIICAELKTSSLDYNIKGHSNNWLHNVERMRENTVCPKCVVFTNQWERELVEDRRKDGLNLLTGTADIIVSSLKGE